MVSTKKNSKLQITHIRKIYFLSHCNKCKNKVLNLFINKCFFFFLFKQRENRKSFIKLKHRENQQQYKQMIPTRMFKISSRIKKKKKFINIINQGHISKARFLNYYYYFCSLDKLLYTQTIIIKKKNKT